MFKSKIYKILLCAALLVVLFLPKTSYANSNSTYNKLGDSYSDKGQYDLAIANYTKAIQQDPQDSYAYNNRGLSYWCKSRNDLAMADYNKAIQLNPRYANAYYNRGLISSGTAEIADFTKAIELNPRNANYYIKRANAYFWASRRDLAVDDYNQVLKMDPNNREAFHGKYEILMGSGIYHYSDSYVSDTSYNPFPRW